MKRPREKVPRLAGHIQKFFDFYESPDMPPEKTHQHLLPLDDPNFAPLPSDIRRIGGFAMHWKHFQRLEEVRKKRRWTPLDRHVEENCQIYASDSPDTTTNGPTELTPARDI